MAVVKVGPQYHCSAYSTESLVCCSTGNIHSGLHKSNHVCSSRNGWDKPSVVHTMVDGTQLSVGIQNSMFG